MNKDPAQPLPKRAGRRPKSEVTGESAGLSRQAILEHADKLAENETVDAITIARLARELGVSTGLIHYFFGSRDDLLAALLNERMSGFLQSLPAPTGHWRKDLEAYMRSTLTFKLKSKGVTSYLSEHNRHRMFHQVDSSEEDYGLANLDHIGRILQQGGFNAAQSAMIFHLAMLFLESVSMAAIRRQEPAVHKRFLMENFSKFDSNRYPGANFIMEEFSSIDTTKTFEQGLELLLDSFERWLG